MPLMWRIYLPIMEPFEDVASSKLIHTRMHSGRVLDSISRGCQFKPHRRHCIEFVSLSKTH